MLGTETHDNVRDLGFIAWRNDLAHLETMNGPQWNEMMRQEKARMNHITNDPAISVRIPAFKESLTEAKKMVTRGGWFSLWYMKEGAPRQERAIDLSPINGSAWRWTYHNGPRKMYISDDIDVDHDITESIIKLQIYTINDVGDGSHDYKLVCRSMAEGEIWEKRGVGPSVSVVGDRVYYLRHEKRLWYNRLCSCNKNNGNDERVEYHMTNGRYNLSIVKVPDRFMLRADNNGRSMLFVLDHNRRIKLIDRDVSWHIPISALGIQYVRFVRRSDGTWEFRYSTSLNIQHARSTEIGTHIIETYGDPYFFDIRMNLVLTRKNGIIYGLKLQNRYDKWNRSPIKLFGIAGGEVIPDIFKLATDDTNKALHLYVEDPCFGPYLMSYDGEELEKHMLTNYPLAAACEFNRIRVHSADGTVVNAAYVKKKREQVRGLMVIIYGAYGSPTAMGLIQKKWAPLLEAGWAIGYAFVRGGGDNGWEWAEDGRRERRYRSIEDAEACISGLRRRLRMPAKHTFIYGRSAGGIQVGALANRNPDGRLFHGIYTEVPYVDVLQTTTNPSLPLTQLEYDEFGDPRHRLADLMFWLGNSPATNVPAQGLPAIFILCRTGLNDTQVYAYEPVKWILRARGQNPPAAAAPKLLAIEPNQGHFYSGQTELDARATDLAILDAYNSGQITTMTPALAGF